jgi:protein-arginine kinase
MGFIDNLDSAFLNSLMVAGQPAHLKSYSGKETGDADLDLIRAEVVRNRF